MPHDKDHTDSEFHLEMAQRRSSDAQKSDKESSPLDGTIRLTPESRFRQRIDGGRDEMFRINFYGRLGADEMRALAELLLNVLDQQPPVGLIALTKMEFIEPDTLEFRFWSGKPDGARLDRMFELWHRMSQIHPILSVDGIHYPWLGPTSVNNESS